MSLCRPRVWKMLLALSGLLLLTILAALFFPEEILTVDSGPVTSDALVVLGGGNGSRPVRAAELFKEKAAPRVICTGSGDCDYNRYVLVRAGVPASNILTESKSRSTHENAEFTVPLLRAQHVKAAIIVTSWYHSRRALRCFEHSAPEIKFYSRPSYPGRSQTEWKFNGFNLHVNSEYLKLIGYWIRYGVCPL